MWDEQGPCGLGESLLFSMPVLSQCFLAFLDLGRAFSSVTRYQVLLKPGVQHLCLFLGKSKRIKATSVKERRAGVPGCVAPRARSRLQALSTPGFLASSPHLPRPLPPDTTVAWRRRARALGGKSFQTSLLGADWPSQTRPGRGSQWETRAARCGRGWDRGRALLARALPGIVVARAG